MTTARPGGRPVPVADDEAVTRDPDFPDATAVRALLADLGAALVATGEPVGQIEDDLLEVAVALGFSGLQVAAGPTGVTLALHIGDPATFAAVAQPLRLDQAADVRELRHQLVTGALDPARARQTLHAIRQAPPRYPRWASDVGWVAVAIGIALIMQPGWANLVVCAVGATLVSVLVHATRRFPVLTPLLPIAAAFVVAALVFAAAQAGWIDGPVRTLLPPLAVLLPGALLVTATSELAAGDMVAGSARLAFGAGQLALFTLGILLAARLLDVPRDLLLNVRVDQIGWYAAPVGLVLISLGIGVMESPPARLLPWITIVLVLAFGAQLLGQQASGPTLGAFLGALAASLGSYLVEVVVPRLPRMVVFLPAFWLLVPGSLGLLAGTQVTVDPAGAFASAGGLVEVIAAIACGLLVSAAGAQAVRGAVRRARRRPQRPIRPWR